MQQKGAQRAAFARTDVGATGNTGAGSGIMQATPLKLFSQAAEHPFDRDSRASTLLLAGGVQQKTQSNLLW